MESKPATTLKHPNAHKTQATDQLAIAPHFSLETLTIPRHSLPDGEMPPDVAYQIIHDELMLDGNARLNVATFVSTWMEPQAEKLMAECFDKNMIDKDEYPQTAEIEARCVNILANLWHAPDADAATGCSTTGSSEAAMLGGLALKRRWQQRRTAEGKPIDKPNLVMGINVQVCWEKFANYWDVEMRLVPMEGTRFTLSAEEAVKLCDENTIGVVAILGSTFDGAYEPVKEICDALDAFQDETGIDVPVHVDGACGAMIAPFLDPDLEWDFRLPRVASINTSGHKYGLVYPGRRLGRLARRGRAAGGPHLLGQLPRRQHADLRAQLLAARRAGRRAVLQLPPARLRRLQARPGLRARRRDAALREDRGDRPLRAPHARRRAAGLRVHAEGRHRQLHGLRRLERPARTRLAGAGVHVPREPHRPRRAARRRAPRLHARHGGHAGRAISSDSFRGSKRSPRRSTTRRPGPPSRTDVSLARLFGIARLHRGSPLQAEALAHRPEPPLDDGCRDDER